MTDDDREKRRARSQGDARDRRRPSGAFGYPVHIDPELTPPPQEPPPIEKRALETLPPPLQDHLAAQQRTIAELTHWVGKLDYLRDGSRLDTIEERIISLASEASYQRATLDSIRPNIDYWRNATDSVTEQLPKLIGSIEAMTLLVGGMDQRLRAVEFAINRHEAREREWEERYVESKRQRAEHALRITHLEQVDRDRITTQKALAKVERKQSRRAGGVVGGGAAVIVGVLWKIAEHLGLLGHH